MSCSRSCRCWRRLSELKLKRSLAEYRLIRIEADHPLGVNDVIYALTH